MPGFTLFIYLDIYDNIMLEKIFFICPSGSTVHAGWLSINRISTLDKSSFAIMSPASTFIRSLEVKDSIQTSTIYQKKLAEYINYKRMERKLVKTDELLERIRKSEEEKDEAYRKK
jgi:hypothetical protein